MAYPLRETSPTPDHSNSDLDLLYGPMTIEEFIGGMTEEALPAMREYDAMWDNLCEQLQWPTQKDGERLSGFTGHRIVTFEDSIGRCALGFHVIRNGGDSNRTITAYRRKIYAQSRRRLNYTSDEFYLYAKSVADYPHNPSIQYRLGMLGVWIDKFNAAEKYE